MAQVVETFSHGRQGPVYALWSIPWLLNNFRQILSENSKNLKMHLWVLSAKWSKFYKHRRSCHGGVAVLLPGFAISNYWEQNQVTRQPHAHDLPYMHFLRYFDQNFIEVVHQPWLWLCRMNRSFSTILFRLQCINTLRLRRNGLHFTNIFKSIFNENFQSLNKISLKYVPWGLIANMAALLQIMAWRRIGDKPLSEAMLTLYVLNFSEGT